jgi:hypothetical protein
LAAGAAKLRNFRVTISPTGWDTYGDGGDTLLWREGAHDDYVLTVAVAVWAGEHALSRVQFF